MSFIFSKKMGKLIFKDLGGYETRNSSTFWCIKQADKLYNWNDFDDIKIFTGDFEDNINDYTYSKVNSYNKIVPDFNFHSWPQVGIDDYENFVKEIDNAGLNIYEINKVGWIGNINTNYRRKTLLQIGKQNNKLFDIYDCGNWSKIPNSILLKNDKYISTPELVKKYSILIDIEGGGYSGRLKHLLWSHRPVLLVDRPHMEFFYEFLKEWVHYIPVKRDLSDLITKTKWCMDNYDKASEIANNAYKFSKQYLTREACYDKWNNIVIDNYK